MNKPTRTKPNQIKAIHIKPLASGLWTVDSVEIPTSVAQKVETIQRLVGGYFEVHTAKVARKNVLVYVNDEALVQGESRGFILGEGRPLFGSAVILAAKDNADLTLSNKQMENALRIFDASKPTA
jgi:hypothetical protein